MSGDFDHLAIFNLSRRSQGVVREVAPILGQLHRRRPRRVVEALLDYATSFWPSFGCPVFRGFVFASAARHVLRLLQAMKVPHIRLICFSTPDSSIAARWAKLLRWPRQKMTFRRPPTGASPAARKWIAIDALFPVSGTGKYTAAKGFPVLMRIAARMASAAGYGSIGWHTFRHKYEILLRGARSPLDVQQRLMRHADIRTTTQYGEVPMESQRGQQPGRAADPGAEVVEVSANKTGRAPSQAPSNWVGNWVESGWSVT